MSYFWQNTDIFTCIQICYYDWPSFNKWYVITNIGHVFGTWMCQDHVTQCSRMEISAYCRWPDLSWPVTTAEISMTSGPGFYPESFSRLYRIAALRVRFLTYILVIYPMSVIFPVAVWEHCILPLNVCCITWKPQANRARNWSHYQSCNIRETLIRYSNSEL